MLRVFVVVALILGAGVCTQAMQDEDSKAGDAFFAGSVADVSQGRLVVARTVRGQSESRAFRLTSQTQIEGHLTVGVRVTVRYVAEDSGDIATMIIVRNPPPR